MRSDEETPQLVNLIGWGDLPAAVAEVQAEIDELNARLDRWEEENPEAAKLTPWAETRAAWKAAGRPPAPWYELLRYMDERRPSPPIQTYEVVEQIFARKGEPSYPKRTRPGKPSS